MSPVKYYLVGPLVFISRFRSARSLMTVRYGSSVFGPTTSLLPTRTLDGTTRAPTASVHVPFDRVRAMPLGHRHPPLLLPFASNIFFLFPSFHFALKCNRTNIFRYRKIECPLTNSNRVNRFSSSFFFFFFFFSFLRIFSFSPLSPFNSFLLVILFFETTFIYSKLIQRDRFLFPFTRSIEIRCCTFWNCYKAPYSNRNLNLILLNQERCGIKCGLLLYYYFCLRIE